jgi:LSD1 subclass zinc finger protein
MTSKEMRDLLEILACPACRKPLSLNPDGAALKCAACHRIYPIRDGIPILLIDQARVEN